MHVCSVASVVSDFLWPCGLLPTRLFSLHGILQARILEWIKIKSPASPALQAASLLLSYRGSPYIIILYKFWYYINLAYTRPCLFTSVKITSPTLNKYNKIKVSFSWKSAILTMMWSEFQKISKNTHRYFVCTHMKGERWKRETDRRKSFLSLWRRVNSFLTSIDIKSLLTLGRTRVLWSTEVVPRPECWDAMLDSIFYEETMEEAKGPLLGFSFHQNRLCLDNVLWLTFWEKKTCLWHVPISMI